MSTWGRLFRVTTFGESHGVGVGCVIDGIPPAMHLSADHIQPQLNRRRPGQSVLTTQRQEIDKVQILSGTENDMTLGSPIALLISNEDQRIVDYAETSKIPRPGHADLTYKIKYGIQASSGGGRASARETLGRVAAGAVAEKWLFENHKTQIVSYVTSVENIDLPAEIASSFERFPPTREEVDQLGKVKQLEDGRYVDSNDYVYDVSAGVKFLGLLSEVYPTDKVAQVKIDNIRTRCPYGPTAVRIAIRIQELKECGDSTGGILTTVVQSVPAGLGEPCFDKVHAELAKAMISLPAAKGFEIGSGFQGVRMIGSAHNDRFYESAGEDGEGKQPPLLLRSKTNYSGGTLGGITSGEFLVFRVAIKPVSSIGKPQETCTYTGEPAVLGLKGRHDSCVLPRVPPVTEAMTALVLMDLAMIQRARQGLTPLRTLSKPRDEEEQLKEAQALRKKVFL